MNKQQREELRALANKLVNTQDRLHDLTEMLRAGDSPEIVWVELPELIDDIETLYSEVSDHRSDEESKFENMSENLQNSDRGQAIEQAASDLNEAEDLLESALHVINEFHGRVVRLCLADGHQVEGHLQKHLADFIEALDSCHDEIESAKEFIEAATEN